MLYSCHIVALITTSASERKATIEKQRYGVLADGVAVDEYTLRNANGVEIKIITYGGIITSVSVPDRYGRMSNIALGFDNLRDYETRNPFFGAITGRYANRIANSKFTLDGVEYTLPAQHAASSPARRHERVRQSGLGGQGACGTRGRRVELSERGRRGRLSGQLSTRRSPIPWITRTGSRSPTRRPPTSRPSST